MPCGENRDLGAVINTDLVEDIVNVAFYRIDVDTEQIGNLNVGESLGDESEGLSFSTEQADWRMNRFYNL